MASQARARHILVETEAQANELKGQITNEEDFKKLAQKHSSCPSSANGGDLGAFGRGQMVPEFDKAIFEDGQIGEVSDPVKTQFGYHLIYVNSLG